MASARILIEGHGLRALAVLEDGQLVGVLPAARMAEAKPEALVRDWMLQPSTVVEGKESIREVAHLLATKDWDYVPATAKGKYLGMVTATMLLPIVGRTYDPLTGLNWSDRLREWGVAMLQDGHEVTILFIDLDDFGAYNKEFGHVVGDRVLQRIAGMLKGAVHESDDLLVRYGGDEFAVASIRPREAVETLGETVQRQCAGLFVGESGDPVSFSVGIFGGRRTREREQIHFAATLDALINMASKAALANKAAAKAAREAIAEAPRAVEARPGSAERQPESGPQEVPIAKPGNAITVIDVSADGLGETPASVTLSAGGKVASGVQSRSGQPLVEAIVLATVKALERLGQGAGFELGEVQLQDQDSEHHVVVNGRIVQESGAREVTGQAPVEGDLYWAAAQATIAAIAPNP